MFKIVIGEVFYTITFYPLKGLESKETDNIILCVLAQIQRNWNSHTLFGEVKWSKHFGRHFGDFLKSYTEHK